MNNSTVSGISYCGYYDSAPSDGFACCRSICVCCDVGLPVTFAGPGAFNLVCEGILRGKCVEQLLRQALGGRAPARWDMAVVEGDDLIVMLSTPGPRLNVFTGVV